MQISTNQFLLGSLNDILLQQSRLNQLNRQIASGQAMLDASTDPAGAGEALGLASGLNRLGWDAGSAQAAAQQMQNGLGVLQQVGAVIGQLRQTALNGANAGNSDATRQALLATAQSGLQQLLQLANTQDSTGRYIFAGSATSSAPFETLADGQIRFAGDGAANSLEVAPSLSVPVAMSGQDVFMRVAAGKNGVAVADTATNTGNAFAEAQSVSDIAQLQAERLAGTQFEIAFSAGAGGTLDYTVTSGTGSPGSAEFSASSSVVTSGAFVPGSALEFGGLDITFTGAPAAGDRFVVQPAGNSSLFETVQGLISALGSAISDPQQIQNAVANLDAAQTHILSAQAEFASGLTLVQAAQTGDNTQIASGQAQLANLQSASLPQVIASYSESVTALQAAELAFAKIQNLSLFAAIS